MNVSITVAVGKGMTVYLAVLIGIRNSHLPSTVPRDHIHQACSGSLIFFDNY
jgi:hypothetical protein